MEYVTHILSFIAGLAAGWTLKVYITNRSGNTTLTNNKAGGDIAGRDIRK